MPLDPGSRVSKNRRKAWQPLWLSSALDFQHNPDATTSINTMGPKKQPSHSMPSTDIASFVAHLQSSTRIVALLGAGLSVSSGLPTFRGAGGYWRTHDATKLATPNAFRNDPGLVWQFYSYRRHMALNARPNRAHLALAELAKRNPNFLTLSQNVDGLSPRAGHPPDQLKLLHGNLFDVKCWDEYGCGYFRQNDFTDPIVPALAIPEDQAAAEASIGKQNKTPFDSASLEAHIAKKSALMQGTDESTANEAAAQAANATPQPPKPTLSTNQLASTPTAAHPLVKGADISSISIPIPTLTDHLLPQCPQCTGLLRPAVVWFGEPLPVAVISSVNDYFSSDEPIDLMLVIGTSSKVWPAAGYADLARQKGARMAVVNVDKGDARDLSEQDWFFEGDAAVIVPELLKSVIGEVGDFQEEERAAGGGEAAQV